MKFQLGEWIGDKFQIKDYECGVYHIEDASGRFSGDYLEGELEKLVKELESKKQLATVDKALHREAQPQQPEKDEVNHPEHYKLPGGGETIDFIESVCGDGVDEYYRGQYPQIHLPLQREGRRPVTQKGPLVFRPAYQFTGDNRRTGGRN